MSFSDMMEVLKEENKGRIVLCNNGSFYIAVGNDAITLNKELGLKLTCMRYGMCKVGFPIEALEKYVGLLIETKYSFIVYDFNSKKEELSIIMSALGRRLNLETSKNKCFNCEKSKNKKIDKYTHALIKMYEREEREIREEKPRKSEKNYEKEE